MLPSVPLFQVALIFFYFKTNAAASDVGLDTVEIITNHGYDSQTHPITTEDGYILTYHRIPRGINDDDDGINRPVVLLMHGLLSSSADYVNMGPDRSLAYILADSGYDVWLGNARGNLYSRNHTTLDIQTDKAQFFNFSWHEIGYYDLAAAIDHILVTTQEDGLYYVGHSQGTTTFFVLTSSRPEYNDKIRLASLLAPVAIMENEPEGFLVDAARDIEEIEYVFDRLGIYEVPFLDLVREYAVENCGLPESRQICAAALFAIGGAPDEDQLDWDLLPVIGSNAPASASIKQFIHYGQQIKAGGFSRFDYGAEGNLEVYNRPTPPPYDFSKITAPVAIYYGKNDDVAIPEDILTTAKLIPNLVKNYTVSFDLFNHVDFIYAKDVVDLVYNEVLTVMKNY